ncbi:helix-hairpin-helix domain-containing protein [Oceanobacillus massiliensis]|uniref:helix-hairpin-helix domain-containing protein n=1 Tax=Oceanobacillus massiliensis TaxID=1465765 RepID=UPI000287D8E7|nr:helix-hairpin-helix domain-containing protein [Oceanobacillus massiliensis]
MLELFKKSSFFIAAAVVVILFIIFTNEDEETIANNLHPAEATDNLQEERSEIDQLSETAIIDVKGAVSSPGVYEMDLDARVNDVIQAAGGFTADADQSQVNLAQKVQDEMIIIVPDMGELTDSNASSASQNGKLRINYAVQEEVETLPGIGPSKAEAIIRHREEFGYFQTIEDLLQVSGIGEKTLENLEDKIQVP